MKPEIVQKIKYIQWHTKRLLQSNLFGSHQSKAKGYGLEFDQLQDYQIGDDIRSIDWNSSARMNKLLIKQFKEPRQQTIIIALDISASVFYTTQDKAKQEVFTEAAAIIAYASYLYNDEVGLLLFSDHVHTYIPPLKGKSSVNAILEKIFSISYQEAQTNLNQVIQKLAQIRKRNTTIFLISDFIDPQFSFDFSSLPSSAQVIALKSFDRMEQIIPYNALLTVKDIESGQELIINNRTGEVSDFLKQRLADQEKKFLKNKVRVYTLHTENAVIDQLIYFFKSSEKCR